MGLEFDQIYDSINNVWKGDFEGLLTTDIFGTTTINNFKEFVNVLKSKGIELVDESSVEY